MTMQTNVQLPDFVPYESICRASEEVLAIPDFQVKQMEDVVTVESLGLKWDLGTVVLEPDSSSARVGADGKKVGIILFHGGSGDYKSVLPMARLLSHKFGYKVLCGTFPGRFYFSDPSHDWPDDTIHGDGSVRTPIWVRGEEIDRDEYEVVQDTSMRDRYGTRTLARAKEGSNFYYRMASWPAAFEDGMIASCLKYFPSAEYSIYGHGHSTGGPFICMLSQRIPNFAGILAMEHSPFGYICAERDLWEGSVGQIGGHKRKGGEGKRRTDPFNELYIRTWRDLARYAGPEALGLEGEVALMRLPALMEDVLESWASVKSRPQFKAEYIVTHDVKESLLAAAQVSANRLNLSEEESELLKQRFIGYTRELRGPNVKPVPPTLFSIAKFSRDHTPEIYNEVIMPAFRSMSPSPRIHLTKFDAGGHSFWKSEPGLPIGVGPSVAKLWASAIEEGYFLV